MRAALVLVGLLAIGYVAGQPKSSMPVFDAKLIVEDVNKCPVKNALFDKEVFDADELVGLMDVFARSNVSTTCQEAATTDLIICYGDGSLAIERGCCSKACADAVKKSLASGCFPQYVQAVCKDEGSSKLQTGLENAAVRCVNFAASCESLLSADGSLRANATAAARAVAAAPANATKAAEPEAVEASPAPAPSPSPSPAPARSSAPAAPAAALPLLAAAALLAAL